MLVGVVDTPARESHRRCAVHNEPRYAEKHWTIADRTLLVEKSKAKLVTGYEKNMHKVHLLGSNGCASSHLNGLGAIRSV